MSSVRQRTIIDVTLGATVTKSGKSFHALVAATGKERSASVARGRLALTTKTITGVDVTGRRSLAVDCQQGIGLPTAVQALVHECTELELYSLRHSQPMKLLQHSAVT